MRTQQINSKATLLTKAVIAKLDHDNRIRKLQKLPALNYDVLEVERLCDIVRGDEIALNKIVRLTIETTLLEKHRFYKYL